MALGYNKPLYILPFDHRGSFQTGMFGWKGLLSPQQTAQIAAAKQVIYDGFKAAVASGIAKEHAGILVAMSSLELTFYGMRPSMVMRPQPLPRRAGRRSSISSMWTISRATSRLST
jgi:hypothetical protein